MKTQHLIFYTPAEHTVCLTVRQGFVSTEEKATLDDQYKHGDNCFCELWGGTLEECLAKSPPST